MFVARPKSSRSLFFVLLKHVRKDIHLPNTCLELVPRTPASFDVDAQVFSSWQAAPALHHDGLTNSTTVIRIRLNRRLFFTTSFLTPKFFNSSKVPSSSRAFIHQVRPCHQDLQRPYYFSASTFTLPIYFPPAPAAFNQASLVSLQLLLVQLVVLHLHHLLLLLHLFKRLLLRDAVLHSIVFPGAEYFFH